MTKAIRILGAAAALAAPIHLAADDTFTTRDGRSVELRPVVQMSCKALRRKIDEIDATGYRGLRPPPVPQQDRPLFEYEIAVSNRYYSTCAAGDDDDGGAAGLRGGFRPERDLD